MVKELKDIKPEVVSEEAEEEPEVPWAKGQWWFVLVAIILIVLILWIPNKFKEPSDILGPGPSTDSSIPPLPDSQDKNAQDPSESAVKPPEGTVLPGHVTPPPIMSDGADEGK
jgi:hypothetical protein